MSLPRFPYLPAFSPLRRRVLAGAATLPLAGLARSAGAPASPSADDAYCSVPGTAAVRLPVPGDAGFLGRLAPRGAPLTFVATPLARPSPAGHRLAFRVRHAGRDFVNPTLVLAQGERLRVTLDNRLAAPTIVHWHGLSVDTANDGAGLTLAPPGGRYAYDFDVSNRGALYWYHPHPHGATAQQAYDGLFGMIDVDDADHAALRGALDLAPGRTELALVVQDRRDGGYAPSPADAQHGFLGDAAFVNGAPCPYADVTTRLYRLRLLNACNARTLCLGFRTASGARLPFTVVGTDGGLMRAPVEATQAFVATAERLDVLVDFGSAPVGETIVMESLAFDPMHGDMTSAGSAPPVADAAAHPGHGAPMSPGAAHDRDRPPAWPDGGARTLMTFRVRAKVRYDLRVPAALASIPPIDVTEARERPLRLGYNKGRWRINDRVFAMGETPIDVARDTAEVWLLRNYHTSMPHAMHLHGFAFDVLERETSPDFVRALAVDDRGRLAADLGRKDTVLVWPGESVRVAIRFDLRWPGPQNYMFHCHNLEHEDGGMMLGVRVA